MKKTLALTSLLLYLVLLFTVTIIPSKQIPDSLSSHDKLIHFLEFFVFAILVAFTARSFSLNPYIWAVLSSVALGFILELVQRLVPTRSFSLHDFYSDILGAFSGLVFYFLINYAFSLAGKSYIKRS